MSEYVLGQSVVVTGHLEKTVSRYRELRYLAAPLPTSGRYGAEVPESLEGVIVGKRALQEGNIHHGYGDEPTVFIRDRGRPVITAYIVAWSLYRKPMLCRPDQIKEAEHE